MGDGASPEGWAEQPASHAVVTRAAATLAVSKELPPPSPITASTPACLANSTASRTKVISGSG